MMNEALDFIETRRNGKDFAFYLAFGDNPFAVSIVCSTSEDGYIAEWVISGIRRKDDKPRFLLRIQSGVSATADELEGTLIETWYAFVKELAYGSANQGGLELPPNSLTNESKKIHADFHLFAHDQMKHFEPSPETVASRTADMFMLVKSLGYVQAQKLVIDFEAFKSALPVPASTTTNRLTTARNKGLIPRTKAEGVAFTTESINFQTNK